MAPPSAIRVLIVDDSAVIRSVISQTLKDEPGIDVVGTACNGDIAIKKVKDLNPDVVILDIEMPVMDGITALPLILKEKPGVKVLICSTLSARGADITLRALSLGAAESILKPGAGSITSAQEFKRSLVQIIRSLHSVTARGSSSALEALAGSGAEKEFRLHRSPFSTKPKVLAIGSSTGGPKALMELLARLTDLPVPIVITQHMPKTFTAILAEHIQKICGLPCKEAAQGDVLRPGHAYVAPGDYHMAFAKKMDDVVIRLNQDPPENYCRPSVNPMLRGLISVYGGDILALILTGMGEDGLQACGDLIRSGGRVIAQDEATSVVWGMPGAVAMGGLCDAVLPLGDMPSWVDKAVKGGAP